MGITKNKVVDAMSLRAGAFGVAALLAFSLSGCKGDAGPAAAVAQPTGTVQGQITDAITKQPIVGAVVDIGVATATTNQDGQYVITGVVLPTSGAVGAKTLNLATTIDMRGVTSPVDMTAPVTATNVHYSDFEYGNVGLTFTALNSNAANVTSINGNLNGTTVTPTPITGLVATANFTPGKLDANIVGVVADKNHQPLGAGLTVNLVSGGSNNAGGSASGTGNPGNIVATATTTAGGAFSFSNIEAGQSFQITAWDATHSVQDNGCESVTAPADGQTLTLSAQNTTTSFSDGCSATPSGTVQVYSTNGLAPMITSVTPEQKSDISPTAAGSTNVVYTFSEPILATAYTDTSAANQNGLYNAVTVNYDGAKAGNVSGYTVAWNATMTQLTVSFPSLAPASYYHVDISGANLVDANNNAADFCGNLTWPSGCGRVDFSTNGAAAAAAPAVTFVNSTTINSSGTNAVLDWLPVSGAVAYNVYCDQTVAGNTTMSKFVNTGTFAANGFTPVTTLTSNYTGPVMNLVSGQNAVSATCVVKSVNADLTESAASNVISIKDVVAPQAASSSLPVAVGSKTFVINFNEPVDEASATTVANYALATVAPGTVATPAIASIQLTGASQVTITLSAATLATNTGNTVTVTGVKDVAGNVMVAGAPVTNVFTF